MDVQKRSRGKRRARLVQLGLHWLCDVSSQLVAQMARRVTSTSAGVTDGGQRLLMRLEAAKAMGSLPIARTLGSVLGTW